MFNGVQYLTYDLTAKGDPIFSSNDRLSLYFKTTHGNGLLFYTGWFEIVYLMALKKIKNDLNLH